MSKYFPPPTEAEAEAVAAAGAGAGATSAKPQKGTITHFFGQDKPPLQSLNDLLEVSMARAKERERERERGEGKKVRRNEETKGQFVRLNKKNVSSARIFFLC